jgi:uncharacterized protein (TIGR03435 family)
VHRNRATRIAVLLTAVSIAAQSQPRKFETASIKPAEPDKNGNSSSRDAGEGLDVRNITVRNLITLAFSLRDFQLIGGPGWINSENYDVLAIAPSHEPAEPQATRADRVRERLRSLLADRFALTVHHEFRDQPVYLLTIASSGPKLTPASTAETPPRKEEGRGHIEGFATPIGMLGSTLSNTTHRIVIDKTGLTGKFDYTLNWDPSSTTLTADTNATTGSAGPSLFTAVQQQLGLRLESGKAAVDVLMIDHVDHQSPN